MLGKRETKTDSDQRKPLLREGSDNNNENSSSSYYGSIHPETNETGAIDAPLHEEIPTQTNNNGFQLLAQDIQPHRQWSLAHLLTREPILFKALFTLFIKEKGIHWYWPKGASIPLNDEGMIKRVLLIKSVLEGGAFIVDKIWPTALLALLTHDVVVYYTMPDQRYGNTLSDIFLGASDNQPTWSSHLGSDLPGEWLYWLAPSAILGTTLFSSFATWVYRRYLKHWHEPGFEPSYSAKKEFNVLWNNDYVRAELEEIEINLLKEAENSNFNQLSAQLNALSAFTKFADGFYESDLKLNSIVDRKNIYQLIGQDKHFHAVQSFLIPAVEEALFTADFIEYIKNNTVNDSKKLIQDLTRDFKTFSQSKKTTDHMRDQVVDGCIIDIIYTKDSDDFEQQVYRCQNNTILFAFSPNEKSWEAYLIKNAEENSLESKCKEQIKIEKNSVFEKELRAIDPEKLPMYDTNRLRQLLKIYTLFRSHDLAEEQKAPMYRYKNDLAIIQAYIAYDRNRKEAELNPQVLMAFQHLQQSKKKKHFDSKPNQNSNSTTQSKVKKPTNLFHIRQRSVDDLNDIAKKANDYKGTDFIKRLYIHYLLWTLNQDKPDPDLAQPFSLKNYTHLPLHFFIFWPLTLVSGAYLLYSKARLVELMINKAWDGYLYFQAKQTCEAEEKSWLYLPQKGDYDCTICGEWALPGNNPFVYLGDIDDSQSCLNGLLASERDPQFILDHLPLILKHPGITTLDLSHQNWTLWSEPQWQQFLDLFKSSVSQLDTFNLSSLTFSYYRYDDNKLDILADFLNQIPVRQLSFKNLNLGDEVKRILQSLVNKIIEYLDFSYNALDDINIANIAGILNEIDLQHLNLAGNQMTGYGVSKLASGISNSTLSGLDISDCPNLNTGDLIPLIQIMPNSTLQYSNFSNLAIDDLTAQAMATFIPGSSLRHLVLVNCNIDDPVASILTPVIRTLTYADFSHNNIGDVTIKKWSSNLGNMTHFLANYNLLSDKSLEYIANNLNGSSLISLEVEGNIFSVNGFTTLLNSTLNALLENLNAAYTPLGDVGGQNLAAILNEFRSRLRFINLAGTGMTDEGVIPVATVIAQTNLDQLILADNALTGATVKAFAQTLPKSSITLLDFSGCTAIKDGVAEYAATLSQTKQQQIILDGTSIGTNKTEIELLIKALVTPIPNFDRLEEPTISRDQSRAVSNAKPVTSVVGISLAQSQITTPSARLICRTSVPAGIPIQAIHLDGNPIDPKQVDIMTCQTSAGSRLRPWEFLRQFKVAYDYIANYWPVNQQLVASSEGYPDYYFNPSIAIPLPEEYLAPQSVIHTPTAVMNTAEKVDFISPRLSTGKKETSSQELPWIGLSLMIPAIHALVLIYVIYRMLSPTTIKTKEKKPEIVNDKQTHFASDKSETSAHSAISMAKMAVKAGLFKVISPDWLKVQHQRASLSSNQQKEADAHVENTYLQ